MWNNHNQQDKGNDFLIIIDATNFRLVESRRAFQSFKFKKSALHYKIALYILTEVIAWINGPYKAGDWNNLQNFCNLLILHLEEGERVEANDDYV